MADDKMEIIVSLKDRFSKGLGLIGKSLRGVGTVAGRVTQKIFSLKAAFLGLTATVGAGAVAQGFLGVAMAFERYETVLKTITGSAKKAKDSMAWVSDFAATTPYELDGITNAFVRLMGGGFDPMLGILKNLGDAAAGMGKPLMQAVEMVLDAVTGSFERLKEFGVVANQQGDTVTFSWQENGKQMVKTAKKTQTAITKALTEVFSRYKGAMDNLSKTFEGIWSNISDHFTIFQKTVMGSGLFEYLKSYLQIFLDQIEKLKEEGRLDEWAKKISDSVVTNFEKMVLSLASIYDVFAPIMKDFKKLFTGLWDWFKELPPEAQKFGLIAFIMAGSMGMKAVAAVFVDLYGRLDEFQKQIKAGIDPIKVRNLKNRIEELKDSLKDVPDWSEFGVASEFSRTTEEIKKLEKELAEALHIDPVGSVIDVDKTKKDAESAVSIVTRFFETMRAKRAELAKVPIEDDKKGGRPTVETPKVTVDLMSQARKDLLALEVIYQKGEEELLIYLGKRKTLMLLALQEEIAVIERAALAEKDVNKKAQMLDVIFVKKKEYQLKEIELIKQIDQARQDSVARQLEVEGMLLDLKIRSNEDLDSAQIAELAEMDERHREELESFKTLLDDKLAAELGYIDEAAALRDITATQEGEKRKLEEKQGQEVWQKKLSYARDAAGSLKGIFEDIYELGGEKNKKMFEAMKIAAIAESMINTSKAITGALGSPPYGLAAIATAGLIAIKGGLEVAKIKAQQMAEGGLIGGASPHSKADNIPINATAGEFMQPVSAVKHYGSKVMEGIKQRLFPKELFRGFSVPALAYASPTNNLAAGGLVASPQGSGFSVSVPINIGADKVAGIAGILQEEVEETVIKVMERELR